MSISSFDSDLKRNLPRMRAYALSLMRDRDRADDLVQQNAMKALAGRESFHPGTNFPAWLFRIECNEFISGLQRARPTVPFDDAVAGTPAHPPHQENGLVMRDFMGALRRLSRGSRDALLLAVLQGQSYKQIASRASVSIGTVKSRMSRGRATLNRMLTGKCVGDLSLLKIPFDHGTGLPTKASADDSRLFKPSGVCCCGLNTMQEFGAGRARPLQTATMLRVEPAVRVQSPQSVHAARRS